MYKKDTCKFIRKKCQNTIDVQTDVMVPLEDQERKLGEGTLEQLLQSGMAHFSLSLSFLL